MEMYWIIEVFEGSGNSVGMFMDFEGDAKKHAIPLDIRFPLPKGYRYKLIKTGMATATGEGA